MKTNSSHRHLLNAPFAAGILAALASLQASAITLTLQPASQQAVVGAPITASLVVSGLGDSVSPSLGTYDFNLAFDQTILGFDSIAFGSGLSINSSSLLADYDVSTPGLLNFYELSGDMPDDLDNLQADSFTLATFQFTGLSAGLSTLEITITAFGDSLGDPLSTPAIQNASVRVIPGAPQGVPDTGMGAPGLFLLAFSIVATRLVQPARA